MLQHHSIPPSAPQRVVVMGAGGFIGGAIVKACLRAGTAVVALGRSEADLLATDGAARLTNMLRPGDAFVMVSARAPCKDPAMMVENIRMAGAVCEALARQPVAHVVYISSDAVYGDEQGPLTETSPAAPGTLHGAMHLVRELMFAATAGQAPCAILRPTLVYGAADPHNGYGPNRFRRLANQGKDIVLFGEGEERRDHVLVDDIAELCRLVLMYRSSGVLNVATGQVVSFRDIAELVVKIAGNKVAITGSPRSGPMPHKGYRPFDPAATAAAFPSFHYTPLQTGLALAQSEEFK